MRALARPRGLRSATLTIDGNEATALPLDGISAALRDVVLVHGAKVGGVDEGTRSGTGVSVPLAELTEALAAARAKLKQLDQATASLAGIGGRASRRTELQTRREPAT